MYWQLCIMVTSGDSPSSMTARIVRTRATLFALAIVVSVVSGCQFARRARGPDPRPWQCPQEAYWPPLADTLNLNFRRHDGDACFYRYNAVGDWLRYENWDLKLIEPVGPDSCRKWVKRNTGTVFIRDMDPTTKAILRGQG